MTNNTNSQPFNKGYLLDKGWENKVVKAKLFNGEIIEGRLTSIGIYECIIYTASMGNVLIFKNAIAYLHEVK